MSPYRAAFESKMWQECTHVLFIQVVSVVAFTPALAAEHYEECMSNAVTATHCLEAFFRSRLGQDTAPLSIMPLKRCWMHGSRQVDTQQVLQCLHASQSLPA